MKAGFVYILTNAGLPGVVKVGQTTRDASKRATELLLEYGTAYPFEVASRHAVSNPAAVEALAHRLLRRRRIPRSELFTCDIATAQKAVKEAAARVLERRWWMRLWYWLTLPQAPRSRSYSRRRGSRDGTLIGLACAAVILPIVIFKPPLSALPSWVPAPFVRAASMLERFR